MVIKHIYQNCAWRLTEKRTGEIFWADSSSLNLGRDLDYPDAFVKTHHSKLKVSVFYCISFTSNIHKENTRKK